MVIWIRLTRIQFIGNDKPRYQEEFSKKLQKLSWIECWLNLHTGLQLYSFCSSCWAVSCTLYLATTLEVLTKLINYIIIKYSNKYTICIIS